MEQEIEKKMEFLRLKWEGKNPMPKTVEYYARQIDRMIFRTLKRKLDRLRGVSGPKVHEPDIVEQAKMIFDVD